MPKWLIADAKEFLRQFQEDDVPGLGAELAYRFLFAIFPFGIFLAALSSLVAGWLRIENPTQTIMNGIGDNLPSNLAGPVKDQLQQVLGHSEPALLSLGGLLTLYAAAGGMNALMKAMTRAYDVPETRPFVLRYGFALLLTLLGGMGIILSFVTVVGGALITQDLASRAGYGNEAYGLIQLLRWPIVFVVLTLAVTLLYRYAPNVRSPWRWSFLGAGTFAVLWIIVTFGFAFYVSNFSHYQTTYGTITGVIVLMLWFYLTSIVLVSCAELVSVLVRAHEPELMETRRHEINLASAEREIERVKDDVEDRVGRRPKGQTAASPSPAAAPPPASPGSRSADDTTDTGASAAS